MPHDFKKIAEEIFERQADRIERDGIGFARNAMVDVIERELLVAFGRRAFFLEESPPKKPTPLPIEFTSWSEIAVKETTVLSVQKLQHVIDNHAAPFTKWQGELIGAFSWTQSPQGMTYWSARSSGNTPLYEADVQFLRELLDFHKRKVAAGTPTVMKKPIPKTPPHPFSGINVRSVTALAKVVRDLDGLSLADAFHWHSTPQGSRYWAERYEGIKPLLEADRRFLRDLLEYTTTGRSGVGT